MPTSHPLNQAVLTQALHHLHHGELRRCQAMGFDEEELAALKQPDLVSLLVNAPVSWCTVSINRDVIKRLLGQSADVSQEIAQIDRMLRLGSSSEMVSHHFGLTHQEVALRRKVLGLPKRKGRYPALDDAQDAALWQQWTTEVAQRGVSTDDETAMLELAMELAEAHEVPLAVLWSSVRRWTGQQGA